MFSLPYYVSYLVPVHISERERKSSYNNRTFPEKNISAFICLTDIQIGSKVSSINRYVKYFTARLIPLRVCTSAWVQEKLLIKNTSRPTNMYE